jgi:hypothetical protein
MWQSCKQQNAKSLKNNMEGNQNNIYFYFSCSYLNHKMPKDPLEDWQKDEPF